MRALALLLAVAVPSASYADEPKLTPNPDVIVPAHTGALKPIGCWERAAPVPIYERPAPYIMASVVITAIAVAVAGGVSAATHVTPTLTRSDFKCSNGTCDGYINGPAR